MSKFSTTIVSESNTVLHFFEKISQIPRGSGKEERIGDFVRDFGCSLELETQTDSIGNIIIRKPATVSMVNHPIVALQCHLDMVQQQVEGLGFDFDNDPIELIKNGDWISANGTTLGADNGIGISLALAVLASKEIAHPDIEVLFTVDEEVGMSGAMAVTSDQLSAQYLINLDMESDQDLTIGCAGAVDVIVKNSYEEVPIASTSLHYEIRVDGGKGGHSGLDIHLGHMNSIKVLGQALSMLTASLSIIVTEIRGGEAANVIPQLAIAKFAIAATDEKKLTVLISQLPTLISHFKEKEANVRIQCTPLSQSLELGFSTSFQKELLTSLNAIPSDVISIHPEIEELVETSNNLSIVTVQNGEMKVVCLARSCIEAHNQDVFEQIKHSFDGLDVSVTMENESPGWTPITDSTLLSVMKSAYQKIIGKEPGVIAIHAGLETGILSNTFPNMEMVSYGPNILSAHTPNERLQVSSVDKVWAVLIETLTSIPQNKNKGTN